MTRASRIRIRAAPAAPAGDIVIAVPAGSLTLTGLAPTVQAPITVTPDAGGLTLTGYIPVMAVSDNHIRAPPKGTLTLTGYVPTVDLGDFIILDVDGDESVYDGQPNVVITVQNANSASGKRIFIEQGGNYVEQTTITGEDLTTVTITVDFGGVLVPGAATLYCWDPL